MRCNRGRTLAAPRGRVRARTVMRASRRCPDPAPRQRGPSGGTAAIRGRGICLWFVFVDRLTRRFCCPDARQAGEVFGNIDGRRLLFVDFREFRGINFGEIECRDFIIECYGLFGRLQALACGIERKAVTARRLPAGRDQLFTELPSRDPREFEQDRFADDDILFDGKQPALHVLHSATTHLGAVEFRRAALCQNLARAFRYPLCLGFSPCDLDLEVLCREDAALLQRIEVNAARCDVLQEFSEIPRNMSYPPKIGQ